MKIFVTQEYFDRTKKRICELNEKLAQIRCDKSAAYTEDTNTWHDNFAYEHLTREEKQTEKYISDLMMDMDNMLIVPTDTVKDINIVGLNCWVCVTQESEDTGIKTKCRLGIVPLGAENIKEKLYAYNTPLVKPLIGLSVGDETTVYVPSGKLYVTIDAIESINQKDYI